MPRGHLKNSRNCSRKKKRGGGSRHSNGRNPGKKVRNKHKFHRNKRTSDLIRDNQRYLRLYKKVNHTTDFTFDDDIHFSYSSSYPDSDVDKEYEMFCEMINDEEVKKQNAKIKYQKSLSFDIEVSSSDSPSFLDHIQKICFNSKKLTLTHKQVGDYPPQGNIVFTTKHKYFVENTITYKMNYGERIQINRGKRIFRKVFMDNGYCCDGCHCEAASTIEPDPNPELTFVDGYDLPDVNGFAISTVPPMPQEWESAGHRDLEHMKYSKDYNSPYIFRPFVTTRYPEDFWVSTCGYCADPNETRHFDFCLDCFKEKYPISVIKMKLFFHRLLKQFQISPDLEMCIVEMLL